MANENLPDPLAELRDIHLPPAAEIWPPAIGWWLLLGIAVICLIAALVGLYRLWQKSAYRRQAQKELDTMFELHQDDPIAYLEHANLLLKRVALSRYDRDQVARLSGESWVAFLDASGQTREFTMGAGQVLIDGQYAQHVQVNVQELNVLIKSWIKNHKALVVEPAQQVATA